MSKDKVLILDKERIMRKLRRMAYEIWEHNSHESDITLIGIEESGAAVAWHLAEILKEISTLKVHSLNIRINKKDPRSNNITINEDLSGRTIILVDDVANSGKTLLFALKPLMDFDLKKIMIAVLVDRKHKSYPVSPDIVGHSVATTLQDHIEVEHTGKEITGAYLS